MRKYIAYACIAGVVGACASEVKFTTDEKQQTTVEGSEVFLQKSFPEHVLSINTKDHQVDVVEQFQQKPLALDILVVIDNSGSMAEEQQGLANKLGPLLSSVADSDWQINIITTDANDPVCSRALIRKSDANSAAKFAAGIQAGINGSGIERGILRAVQGIECDNNWVRNDSTLAVLVVSDEDNCSDRAGIYGCQANQAELNGDLLLNKLSSIRVLGETARIYGIIFGPNDNINECSGFNNTRGTFYSRVINASKGVAGKICAANYTPTLARISSDLSALLKDKLPLAQNPVEGSVKVMIGEEEYEDFNIVDQSIQLKDRLKQGQEISIAYSFIDENQKMDRFKLGELPRKESLDINLDGTTLSPRLFDIEGQEIILAEGLGGGHEVTVRYEESIELNKDFYLEHKNIVSSVVTVNGQIVAASVDLKNGVISFQQAPPEGAKVQVDYKYYKRRL